MGALPRRGLLAGAAALAVRHARAAMPALTLVASFDQQVTGVAVARNGRSFVCFPRWEQDVPISVAELGRGDALTPFPDRAWNSWSNLKKPSPLVSFVCVQSVTVDPQGFLWILDAGAPATSFLISGAPKLLKVDLANDHVVLVVRFDAAAAPQGAYLNDMRVTPDGRHAFLTDSGLRGALLVVDVPSGRTRRVLDGDARTGAEPGVIPLVDGHELRRLDNRPLVAGADGITLDAAGQWLYWQALAGRTLYRVPVAALIDPDLSPARLSGAVERVTQTHVADGLWMDEAGYLFLSNPAENAVDMRSPAGAMVQVARDDRLRWPDSLAEGADGSIYVTASHIPDMAQFKPGSTARPTTLWRIAKPHG